MEKYSVKKTILALGLAVLMLGSLAGRVQREPSTGTRVAVVNVGLVFSKYQKAIFYKAELENTLKPFKAKGEKIAADMKMYGEAIKNKNYKDAKMKDDYEQYFLKLKRDLEDLDGQARKLIGSKQEEQIITLFKEVTALSRPLPRPTATIWYSATASRSTAICIRSPTSIASCRGWTSAAPRRSSLSAGSTYPSPSWIR